MKFCGGDVNTPWRYLMILSRVEELTLVHVTHFFDWWAIGGQWKPLVDGLAIAPSSLGESSSPEDIFIELLWGITIEVTI